MNDDISVEEIGTVMKARRTELTNVIKEAVNLMQRLDEFVRFFLLQSCRT